MFLIRIRVPRVPRISREPREASRRGEGVWNIDQGRINRTTEYKWVHLQRKEQREFRRTNSRSKTSLLFFHPFWRLRGVAWSLIPSKSTYNRARLWVTNDQKGGEERQGEIDINLINSTDVLPHSRVETFPRSFETHLNISSIVRSFVSVFCCWC